MKKLFFFHFSVFIFFVFTLFHNPASLLANEISFSLKITERDPSDSPVQGTVEQILPCGQIGASGYLRIEMRNQNNREYRIYIRHQTSSPFESSLHETLPASKKSVFWLPSSCLAANNQQDLLIGIDMDLFPQKIVLPSTQKSTATLLNVLLLSEFEKETLWSNAIDVALNISNPNLIYVKKQRALELPPDWAWLNGFNLIIIDGRENYSQEQIHLLQDYLKAGGAILFIQADSLLPELIQPLFSKSFSIEKPYEKNVYFSSYYFGEFFILWEKSGLTIQKTDALLNPQIVTWLSNKIPNVRHHLEEVQKNSSSNQRIAFIDGLFSNKFLSSSLRFKFKHLPTLTFLILLLIFSIIVGPLNYFYFSRYKKNKLGLLISTPTIGFLFTASILLYGKFGDGYLLKTAIQTFTYLNQADQQTVSYSSSTSFSDLPRSKLTLAPKTWVISNLLSRLPTISEEEVNDELKKKYSWHMAFDKNGNFIAGSILPARSINTLSILSIQHTKEKIRFQKDATNHLNILPNHFITPSPTTKILVRDFEGIYHLFELAKSPATSTIISDNYFESFIEPLKEFSDFPKIKEITANLHEIPVGSYLLLSPTTLFIDSLGLDSTFLYKSQLIFGLLGKEDILYEKTSS